MKWIKLGLVLLTVSFVSLQLRQGPLEQTLCHKYQNDGFEANFTQNVFKPSVNPCCWSRAM